LFLGLVLNDTIEYKARTQEDCIVSTDPVSDESVAVIDCLY